MREWDYPELKKQQAELFVLKQILAKYSQVRETDLYITPSPLNSIASGELIVQDALYQHMGLKGLEQKQIIHILELTTLNGIHLSITNLTLLKSLYIELRDSIPAVDGSAARIVYSLKSGRGKINGEPFKLNRKSRNRKVFDHLVKNPNTHVTKRAIWRIAKGKEQFLESQDGTIEFNTIITTLRESLNNISPQHLRLKKDVTLYAEVTLTD